MCKIYHFLFVFFPIVSLLLMGIFLDTTAVNSTLERRKLAEWPKYFFLEPNQFEKYVSDHLSFRDKLISFYFKLGLGFNFGTDAVFIGKDNWLFQKASPLPQYNLPPIKSFQNKVLFSDEEHMKIISNLLQIKKLCDENHIHLYIIFPPDKHRIYARYMPSYIFRDKRQSPVKQLVSLLPSEITIVPLEDMLLDVSYSSKELLYYKQDSHWSEEGAFWAYQQLIKNIQKDFPQIHPLTKSDFDIEKRTDIYSPYYNWAPNPIFASGSLLIPGMKYTQKYKHYEFKRKNDIQINHDTQFISSTYSSGIPLRVYIIGDSFASYLHPFLSATFQYVHAYRFNAPGKVWGIRFYERLKEMQADKTDILILSVSDLKLKDLLEPF